MKVLAFPAQPRRSETIGPGELVSLEAERMKRRPPEPPSLLEELRRQVRECLRLVHAKRIGAIPEAEVTAAQPAPAGFWLCRECGYWSAGDPCPICSEEA